MSKASEDISPISRDVYRRLYREGTNLPHTIIQRPASVELRDFAELYVREFSTIFKMLFPAV